MFHNHIAQLAIILFNVLFTRINSSPLYGKFGAVFGFQPVYKIVSCPAKLLINYNTPTKCIFYQDNRYPLILSFAMDPSDNDLWWIAHRKLHLVYRELRSDLIMAYSKFFYT